MGKKQAGITGIFYLLLALIAPFSLLFVPSQLIVEGNGAATAVNILNNQLLFRLGIVGETLIFLIEIVVVVLLYRMFEGVNKTLSLGAAAARLAMTVIQGVNILFYLAALELLNNPEYSAAFRVEGRDALVSFLLRGHGLGVYVWQVFFGFHLLLLGWLVVKSGYLPKVIGVLLMAASLGYLADSYTGILLAGQEAAGVVSALLAVSTIGEVVFTFALLLGGLGFPKRKSAGDHTI